MIIEERRPFVTLEPRIRCPNRRQPRCPPILKRAAVPNGMLECEKCGRHWWTMHLVAGDVRPQVGEMFDDDEQLIDGMMTLHHLPEQITEPAYLQIECSGKQWHRYATSHELSYRARTLAFLRDIIRHH